MDNVEALYVHVFPVCGHRKDGFDTHAMTLKLTLFLSLSPFFTRLLCKHRYTLGKSCADADGLSSTVIVFECDPILAYLPFS